MRLPIQAENIYCSTILPSLKGKIQPNSKLVPVLGVVMDANQYYQMLLQQGHSPADAAHFTSQYYPGFQAPMQGAGMMAPPPSMEFGSMAFGMGSPYGGYTGGSMGAPAGFGYSSMGAGGMAALVQQAEVWL